MSLYERALQNVRAVTRGFEVSEELLEILVEKEIENLTKDREIVILRARADAIRSSDRHRTFMKHIQEQKSHVVIEKSRSAKFVLNSKNFEDSEKHPELDVLVLNKDNVLNSKNDIIKFFDSIKEKRNFHCMRNSYASFVLNKENRYYLSSHAVNVSLETFEEDINRLYSHLEDLFKKILDNIYGYEQFFEHFGEVDSVFIMKTYYELIPNSIESWGISDFEINTGFCKLFCANDTKVSCILQCSRFLFKEDLFDMNDICKKNVLILSPKSHIKSIKDIKYYYDLKIDTMSPLKSFNPQSINNIDVLLLYEDHIGVLHSFKPIVRKNNCTTYTPLNSSKTDNHLTVIFDIEAYFDPDDENNQINIPYVCCYTYIVNDVITEVFDEEGADSVLYMLENISNFCISNNIKKVELVAHNGGNYDFHYILSSIPDPSKIKKILIRNNSFISFNFEYNTVEFGVKDSYSFLLCSLKNAARAFLSDGISLGKTEFPHHELRKEEDLYKVFQEWESIDEVVDVVEQQNKMIISSHHIMNYKKNGEFKTLIEWSREYCRNDVIVLANVWREFKLACQEIFGAPIVDSSYTLAGMSFNLFKAHSDPNVFLNHPIKQDYMRIRKALYGGRCVNANGMYSDILCLDVKSLYPAAMSYYDQPHGEFYKTKKRDFDKLGIYYIRVEPNVNAPSSFFPLKTVGGETVYNIEDINVYYGWYTSVDINIGVSEGHKIEYVPFDTEDNVGYEWKERGKIFKDYIQNTLYILKNKYEKEGNKVKRNVIKIIMNSLWGKFAQKWMDTECFIDSAIGYTINPDDNVFEIWNTEYFLIKQTMEKEYGTKPVQNGVFTLSWARWHMKKIWDATVKPYTKYIYSDTDSIFIKRSDFNMEAKIKVESKWVNVIGDELGQLELEDELDSLICAGKKQYIGFKNKGDESKYKSRFKGIPSKYIVPDMYEFILKEGNIASVEFIKFKRLYGAIKGYTERKTVRAT